MSEFKGPWSNVIAKGHPDYWCCKADFGKHEETCKHYHGRHDYPPVWDNTLKAWINRPPHAKPGQGAKE